MYSTPTLHTPRLVLRALTHSDDALLFSLRTNPLVNQYVPITPPASMEEVHTHMQKILDGIEQRKCDFWTIITADQQKPIGTITLWNYDLPKASAEIGFVLDPEFWGKGIITEAAEAVLAFGRNTMQFKHIEGWAHEKNLASIKVLQKLNFRRNTEAESQIDTASAVKDFQIWVIN